MRVMSLGDNVDAEGAPMVAQSIYTIVQTIVSRLRARAKRSDGNSIRKS